MPHLARVWLASEHSAIPIEDETKLQPVLKRSRMRRPDCDEV
jgi:hypothetical protein